MEKKHFIDDINIKGALTGILIRSPVVTGILEEIKTPKLPYNITLVTAADIPGSKVCRTGSQSGSSGNFQEIPIFPEKELSWYGQPVAMLLGPDPANLRELAEQCSVIVQQDTEKEKTIIERNFNNGSVAEAFEKSELIVEGNYFTGLQDPWPSDPPGAIAVPGPKNTVTIHTCTQWPPHVRSSVAECLNIKSSMVEVEVSRLEIHLDGKIWPPSVLACQAAIGAKMCGKAVKLILKRDEDFLFSPKSAGTEIRIQSALDKQGAILGTKLAINANFGAFGIFAPEILDCIALGALGAYSHKNVTLKAQGFSSPIPPAGPIVGFGLVQGFFAAERHASHIAEALGEDPAEWKKKSFLRRGKKLPLNAEIKNPPVEALIDSAQAMSGYRRKWAAYELLRKNRRHTPLAEKKTLEPLRGIGISLAYQGNSLLHNSIDSFSSQGWGCAVVEAEIDPVSFMSKVRGIWISLDAGTMLLEERAKKNIHAASLEALSWAMQEQVAYVNGRIAEADFKNYQVWPEENPPVTVDFLWSEGNPRSIGEIPFATIPAAYAQALSQALDYHFNRYPIDSPEIWKAVQKPAEEGKT